MSQELYYIDVYLYIYLGKLTGIRRESVNYVGYYSQHEETMKEVILSQVLIYIFNITGQSIEIFRGN